MTSERTRLGKRSRRREQHGHRDVVGQVGDESRRCRSGELGDRKRVGDDDVEAVSARGQPLGDGRGERSAEHRVDLDRDDAPDALEQSERERAEAGADLDDDVVLVESRRAHDAAHRVGVDDEVLAERLGRPHAQAYGEARTSAGPSRPGSRRSPRAEGALGVGRDRGREDVDVDALHLRHRAHGERHQVGRVGPARGAAWA
jgi:hypothetical protein